MAEDIDRILRNSDKAEFLERLDEMLIEYNKVVIVLVKDKEGGGFDSQTVLLGIDNDYDACGIMEVAKHDLLNE